MATRRRTVAVTSSGEAACNKLNEASKIARLTAMESQLHADLRATVESFERPAFTWAAIAGDMVLLHAIAEAGLLPKMPVIFIDTLHLFPETTELLRSVEKQYGFKAVVVTPQGAATKAEWNKKYKSDLYMTDPERYDQLAKVEPLARALQELGVGAWVNGRRRDHGAERAALPIFEPGAPVKVNPLAFWSFEDCFAYLDWRGVPRHPLHAEGFPSVGDLHSTVPVKREEWFAYAGERRGRFQGLSNTDGSAKTECGIHNKMGGAASSGLTPPASSGLTPPAGSSSIVSKA